VQLRQICLEFLSEKIGLKRLYRVVFYIWILFLSVAVLLLFQINLSGSGLGLITHPTWMICKCVEA